MLSTETVEEEEASLEPEPIAWPEEPLADHVAL
jgi:hypothetical protein